MRSLTVPQWRLVVLLGAVYVIEHLMFFGGGRGAEFLQGLPGVAGLIACVVYAFDRPLRSAAIGSAVVIGASLLGLDKMSLTEMLAGAALVVVVIWREKGSTAVVGTAALTVSCLVAMSIRSDGFGFYPYGSLDPGVLAFGFILLAISIGLGLYLRRVEGGGSGARIPQHWPLAVAFAVLYLLDVNGPFFYSPGTIEFQTGHYVSPILLVMAGSLVAAVCAVLAPRAPVTFALIGAAAIGLATVPMLILQAALGAHIQVPFTLTQLGASGALIVFVVRQAKPWAAALSTVALVAVNLTALVDGDRYGNIHRDFVLPFAFLLAITVAIGLYFRARDRERTQSVRVAVSGAQNAERLALARELHDVVAHHVTGIVVQAQAARLVADRNPAVAVGALAKIENSGTEALTAMRMLVGSLRTNQPAGESTAAGQATTDLASDIRALVDQFQGLPVHLELDLPRTMPTEMGRSVLRLVQESLTNVTKHASGATTVRVRVGADDDELHVSVKDDGTARRSNPVGGSGGYGLIGMRERVELLGGFFSAGPGADGGWLVKVALPLRSK